jgi:uncharacterized protein YeaO (DUF488 family)
LELKETWSFGFAQLISGIRRAQWELEKTFAGRDVPIDSRTGGLGLKGGSSRSVRMKIQLKRAYEPPSNTDGCRILVDRIWPRGVRKEEARIDLWLKDLAPSTVLRKWFAHDSGKWKEFKKRYFAELDGQASAVEELIRKANQGVVTFVYGAKEPRYNNAVALKEYLEILK